MPVHSVKFRSTQLILIINAHYIRPLDRNKIVEETKGQIKCRKSEVDNIVIKNVVHLENNIKETTWALKII